MTDFSKSKIVTARNEYLCVFCNRNIGIGERYERTTGKHDGAMASVAAHLACTYTPYPDEEIKNDTVAVGVE